MKLLVYFLLSSALTTSAFSQVTLTKIAGSPIIRPGENFKIHYEASGSGLGFNPNILGIVLLSDSPAPHFGSNVAIESMGTFTVPTMIDRFIGVTPVWVVSAGEHSSEHTAPEGLDDASWSSSIRFRDSVPPGDYHLVVRVISTVISELSFPVVVPEIEITQIKENSARYGEDIEINGVGLSRVREISINGEALSTLDWDYDETDDSITATVPNGAELVGKIEVGDDFHTVRSPEDFLIELPDLVIAEITQGGGQVILSHDQGVSQSSPLETNRPIFLRFEVLNQGTDRIRSSMRTQVRVDTRLVYSETLSSTLSAGSSIPVSIELDPLSAGSHKVEIVVDSFDFIDELNEINNELSLSFDVIAQASPLELWRTSNFLPTDLADPTKENSVWGDSADPDKDGLSNLVEAYLGSLPLEASSPAREHRPRLFGDMRDGLMKPSIKFLRTNSVEGLIFSVERSNTLIKSSWQIPPQEDFSVREEPAESGGGTWVFFEFAEIGTTSEFYRFAVSYGP